VNDIARVISRLEQQRATIDRAISALREVEQLKPAEALSSDGSSTAKPKRRRMSAEARRRIGEATRRRWAEKRAAESKASSATSRKKTGRKNRSSKRAPAAA